MVEQNKRHDRPAAFGNRNQLKVENQNLNHKTAVTVAPSRLYLNPHELLIISQVFFPHSSPPQGGAKPHHVF